MPTNKDTVSFPVILSKGKIRQNLRETVLYSIITELSSAQGKQNVLVSQRAL